MESHAVCPKCISELPPGALEGLCPQCLMKAVLESDSEAVSPLPAAPPHFLDRNELPDSGSSDLPSTESIPGYEMLGEVHRGGQGVVYQAIQKATKRRVAIKVMRKGPFSGPHERSRFDREVRILAALRHPHIVSIHDSGSVSGSFYFTMDYIPGNSLDHYVQQHDLPINDILRLFAKVCDAVNAAHLRGIIHRDLKPANIRVDPQGEPHILDFGLARVALGGTTEESRPQMMTMTGEFVGSPPWASPEQAEGLQDLIDIRADVYALGVILFQILTGRFPYEVTGNVLDVLERVRSAEPIRPGTLRKDIGDEVETIILKCLAKDRDRRYQSAGELARDINHYLAGEPIEAKRDSAFYVLRKVLQRYRLPVAVAAAFVALISVSLVVSISLGYQAQQNYRSAEQGWKAALEAQAIADAKTREAESSAREARRRLYSRQMVLAQQSLTGDCSILKSLLEQCPAELRGWEWYRLKKLADRSRMTINAHRTELNGFSLSTDGLRMVSAGDDPAVQVWDARTGGLLETFNRPGESGESAAFGPTGEQIAFSISGGTFEFYDISASQSLWKLTLQEGPHLPVLFLPESGRIAVSATSSQISLLDENIGKVVQTLQGHDREINSFACSRDGRCIASASFDGTVRLWQTATGDLLHVLKHGTCVFGAAFSQDGSRVATASEDKTVRIWDTNTGRELLVLRGHSSAVNAVAFSMDGLRLCSGGRDATLRLWDATTGKELAVLRGHTNSIIALEFTPDGISLVSAARDPSIKLWDSNPPPDECTISITEEGVVGNIVFNANSQQLYATVGETLRVWDVSSGREIGRGSNEAAPGIFSPDQRRHIRFDDSRALYIEDTATGTSLRIGDGRSQILYARFNPDGTDLATVSDDGTLQTWDVTSGRLLGHVNADIVKFPTSATFAYSPDGTRIAVCSRKSTLRLWDAKKLQPIGPAFMHPHEIWGVTFSPDGSRVVTAGIGDVRVLDAETGELLSAFGEAQEHIYLEVAFSPNGRSVAALCSRKGSGAGTATIKIWDTDESYEPITQAPSAGTVLKQTD